MMLSHVGPANPVLQMDLSWHFGGAEGVVGSIYPRLAQQGATLAPLQAFLSLTVAKWVVTNHNLST